MHAERIREWQRIRRSLLARRENQPNSWWASHKSLRCLMVQARRNMRLPKQKHKTDREVCAGFSLEDKTCIQKPPHALFPNATHPYVYIYVASDGHGSTCDDGEGLMIWWLKCLKSSLPMLCRESGSRLLCSFNWLFYDILWLPVAVTRHDSFANDDTLLWWFAWLVFCCLNFIHKTRCLLIWSYLYGI